MSTVIYFMRHSEPLKYKNINNNDSLQLQNETWCFTINGQNIAKNMSKFDEVKDFNTVIASNYVRGYKNTTMQIMKDRVNKNNIVEVISEFEDFVKPGYYWDKRKNEDFVNEIRKSLEDIRNEK